MLPLILITLLFSFTIKSSESIKITKFSVPDIITKGDNYIVNCTFELTLVDENLDGLSLEREDNTFFSIDSLGKYEYNYKYM